MRVWVIGQSLRCMILSDQTVGACYGAWGMRIGKFCGNYFAHAQSDLSISLPLVMVIIIIGNVYLRAVMSFRRFAGTVESFFQFPLPNFPQMAWIDSCWRLWKKHSPIPRWVGILEYGIAVSDCISYRLVHLAVWIITYRKIEIF